VLLTLHRAENVDDPARLRAWLAALDLGRPVLFPVHPRTAATMRSAGIAPPPDVTVLDPVGYLEMVALERAAAAVATDSGGVQKEAYLAGVPCLTLRTETEWTETVDVGWNRLVGPDPSQVAAALGDARFMDRTRARPELFGDGRAASRIVAALEDLQRAGSAGRTTVPSGTPA
jgi:UDP-N-acetylglucosamine 2-epimerase